MRGGDRVQVADRVRQSAVALSLPESGNEPRDHEDQLREQSDTAPQPQPVIFGGSAHEEESSTARLAVFQGQHRQLDSRVDVELGVGVFEVCVDGVG